MSKTRKIWFLLITIIFNHPPLVPLGKRCTGSSERLETVDTNPQFLPCGHAATHQQLQAFLADAGNTYFSCIYGCGLPFDWLLQYAIITTEQLDATLDSFILRIEGMPADIGLADVDFYARMLTSHTVQQVLNELHYQVFIYVLRYVTRPNGGTPLHNEQRTLVLQALTNIAATERFSEDLKREAQLLLDQEAAGI